MSTGMTRRHDLWRIYRAYASDPAFDRVKADHGPKLMVPGRGSLWPRLVFVGEAPGEREAATRRPFTGPAGRVLNTLLRHIGLTRSEIFITNLVKYRPTIGVLTIRNRTPTPDEQRASKPYLLDEISVFDQGTPVITLGSVAMGALHPLDHKISDVHGQGWYDADRAYVTLYHPAVAVYDEAMMPVLLADMARVKELL